MKRNIENETINNLKRIFNKYLLKNYNRIYLQR